MREGKVVQVEVGSRAQLTEAWIRPSRQVSSGYRQGVQSHRSPRVARPSYLPSDPWLVKKDATEPLGSRGSLG